MDSLWAAGMELGLCWGSAGIREFGNSAPGIHATKPDWMENRLPAFPDPGRAGLESSSDEPRACCVPGGFCFFLGMAQLSCSLLRNGSCFPQAGWGPVSGEGGGSATRAGTVPTGVWGGLKGPPPPPATADKIPEDVVTLQPGFLARAAVPALSQTSGMSNPGVEGTGQAQRG